MNWRDLLNGGYELYLLCECGWSADVDPQTIRADHSWPVPRVVKALPCRKCGETGLDLTITSQRGLGVSKARV